MHVTYNLEFLLNIKVIVDTAAQAKLATPNLFDFFRVLQLVCVKFLNSSPRPAVLNLFRAVANFKGPQIFVVVAPVVHRCWSVWLFIWTSAISQFYLACKPIFKIHRRPRPTRLTCCDPLVENQCPGPCIVDYLLVARMAHAFTQRGS